MDTLVILDLRPVWQTLRSIYDQCAAKALMITFDSFMLTVFEAYRVEMNAPGSSDVILDSATDLYFTEAPEALCDNVKAGFINAVNLIDSHLTWVMTSYFNASYLGGIRTIEIVPNTYTLKVVYGKEEL